MRLQLGRRGKSAFTLVEILVVILIVGMLATMGAMVITPQISYFRSRRDGENVLLAIRRARSLAMARGGNATAHYGVTIFRGQLSSPDRASVVAFTTGNDTPWSYVEFADRDENATNNDRNLNEVTRPTLGITLASALTEQGNDSGGNWKLGPSVVNLHEETRLLGIPYPGTQLPLADNTVIEFDSAGRLQTDSGKVSSLIPEPTSSPEAYSFDIQNPNMGYYRIRIRTNGSIEISALTEDGIAPYIVDFEGKRTDF